MQNKTQMEVHGLGRSGGLGFAKPAWLEELELPYAGLRNFIAPLRDGAGRDPKQLRQRGCVTGQFDCLLRLHSAENFSTLKA